MESDGVILAIEPRDKDYVLSRTAADGTTTELVLSEIDLMFLVRLVPQVAREISASKAPAGSDVSAIIAVQVRQFYTGCDLHQQAILLRLEDEAGCLLDFSFDPAQARQTGEALISWADQVGNAPKPTRQ
jgi:hypothetical protein